MMMSILPDNRMERKIILLVGFIGAIAVPLFLGLFNKGDLHIAAQQPKEYFPLSLSTHWKYRGTVKWTEAVNEVKEGEITWEMEVEKRLKNGSFEIAVMKGHPADLCWYEPGKKRGTYLIAWKDNRFYEIRINNDFGKLTSDESYLSSKANFNSLFLAMPLKKDMEFGNDPDIQRDDRMYEWVVENEQKDNLFYVSGISEKKTFTKYTLIYRTLPDHQIVDFVPFIGITRFIYVHHGTVSEVDVRLAEFRKR